ncbi:unknown protein [Oryza sativa Japonica Group]|uniref:Os01g0513500 protein n=2 Tax=Oryza sativa subsp. japonica TaxID=39947 RepID=Q5QNC9_ORYSJ|nr:hypothetical protein EE612_003017 [Oryza sativa]BAD73085.1 unknown protein [Oryza sativa Japonica Group]BAS72398.1 Os01g0513500 [Oryza sativa Japonica Group]
MTYKSLGEAGRYKMVSEPGAYVAVAQAWCAWLLWTWSGHSMAHALALDTRTWPRGDVPGLGLIDGGVDLS